MSIFGSSIDNLHHGLDYAFVKNEAISNNLANISTTNYKAKSVEFKSLLEQEKGGQFQAKLTNPRHIDFSQATKGFKIHVNNNTQYNHNGNNVDIDKEMVELGNNQIYQQALVERLNGSFSTLQNLIRGGS
ncbi:flagellar basal body rod protein FlgB [Amphibacillus sp. MSJ-3]|uniref:flagellar basal body rod protein FlgB n=1 Tax=Amphibacillus sp. MSJ-3 TaxID=2841505 RepID=UPI001C0ECA69|nr:flagellar basal body rod protein FlgB [Amphibacillus sp. MSJ-3]